MMHKGDWHEKKWRKIEEEYGEPAREVVRDMLDNMHCPQCLVAATMGVALQTLQKWCDMWGLQRRNYGYHKMPVRGKVVKRAQELGYESVSQAISIMRVSGLRWNDVRDALQCSESTMCRYYPESARGYQNLTEAGREAKRESARRLNASGKAGRFPPLSHVHPMRGYDNCSRL